MGLVREAGVEPARPCEHWHLKPASLPIPPLAHPDLIVALAQRKRDNTTAGRPCQQLFSKNFIFFFGGWSEGRGDSHLGRPPPHPSFAPQMPPSPPVGGKLCGRPHGAAPTNPNERGGLTPPHPAQCTHWATFPPRGRSGAPGRPRPSSSQTPYRSLPPDGESSLIPLLLLSPSNPRLPPLGFGGDPKMIHFQFSIINF